MAKKAAKRSATTRNKQAAPEKVDAVEPCEARNQFPIVGVGASAGGLQALQKFFSRIGAESGMSYIIVQHLDPSRESLTAEILSRYTSVPVVQVADHPLVRPNSAYVIPSNKSLTIKNGRLDLGEREPRRGSPTTIDVFLRSLAEDQKQCAVGVILSGSGTDGTLGVKAIKRQGGLVIVQTPESAEHNSMPRSAIATGAVDFVLPPEEIPPALENYRDHPELLKLNPVDEEDRFAENPTSQAMETDVAELDGVLMQVRVQTKHDFRNYKINTLMRRTLRRMCLHHLESFAEYIAFLKKHPEETEALVKDLLISVTDFFRDPDSWEALAENIIAPLVERKSTDDPVRVWISGCATGEEPYSVAMLIIERLHQSQKNCPVQVFASDIDKDALEYARQGLYPVSIEEDVSPSRLKRFFVKVDGDHRYRVSKALREAVVFAEQNLIGDPPFSKLDLICCRNVLIYMKPDIQEKIIKLFHFALAEGGFLFLGSSETIGRDEDLFETVSKRWRIYRRLNGTRQDRIEIPISSHSARRDIRRPPPVAQQEFRLTNLAQQQLLNLLSPSAVLIDRSWHIRYISGDIDPFLTHSPGVPTDDLLSKARQGLRTKLRGAVRTALEENQTITFQTRVRRQGSFYPVQVAVHPLKDRENEQELALVLFEEMIPDPEGKSGSRSSPTTDERHAEIDEDIVIRQLEDELASTKEDLYATIEQQETSNEESKAANEEIMSINEELQSTNEELETSKEELQSLNEELTTVNNQLSAKVDELETKQEDLNNLLAATDVATICLDTDLRVRWFTPAAMKLIRLTESDKGRPLSDFAHDFTSSDLVQQCERVLSRLIPEESEVTASQDRTFLRRIGPYRTEGHRIGGVVVTFVDITSRKSTEKALIESEKHLRLALDSADLGSWEADLRENSLRTGARHAAYLGLSPETQFVTREDWARHILPEDREQFQQTQQEALQSGELTFQNEYRIRRNDGEVRIMSSHARIIRDEEGTPIRLVGVTADVTEHRAAERELRELTQDLEQQVANRVKLLEILQDVAIASNEAQTVPQAMQSAIERICKFDGWSLGHVFMLAPDDRSRFIASDIWHITDKANLSEQTSQAFEEFRVVIEELEYGRSEGWFGQITETGRPVVLNDLRDMCSPLRESAERLGLRACVAFPVLVDHEVSAVLTFFANHPIREEQPFLKIMHNVGIQLGYVIERKRLEQAIAEATHNQQRHFGRELHDSIAQELTGMMMMGQTIQEELTAGNAPQAEKLATLIGHMRRTNEQVRRLSRGLMPVEVDGEGLVQALQELVTLSQELYGVKIELHSPPSIEVDDQDRRTHLYRIAQEAIQNAVKHGRPEKIEISIEALNREVILKIEDDGNGFDASAVSKSSSGLKIMRYRANLIGGTLDIKTHPGDGATLTCRLPAS